MGLPTPPEPLGGPPNPYLTSRWASRPVLHLRVGLPTYRISESASQPLSDLRVSFSITPDHSRTFGWAPQPRPDLRVCLPTLPNFWVGLQTAPGPLAGPPNPSRTSVCAFRPSRNSGWALRPLPIPPGPRVGLPTHPAPKGRPPDLSDLRVCLPTPLKSLGGPPDPSQTFGWASQPLQDHRVALLPHNRPSGGSPDLSESFGWASQPLLNLQEDSPISTRPPGEPSELWLRPPTLMDLGVGLPSHPEPVEGSPGLNRPSGRVTDPFCSSGRDS